MKISKYRNRCKIHVTSLALLTIHIKDNVARIASLIYQHPLGWFMTLATMLPKLS